MPQQRWQISWPGEILRSISATRCCARPWSASLRSSAEALAQLGKREPSLLEKIDHYRQIIAFRNILIHGYAEVDDALVWDIVQSRLKPLQLQIDVLLTADK
jgi:uncharacterized protein with HEPN domain